MSKRAIQNLHYFLLENSNITTDSNICCKYWRRIRKNCIFAVDENQQSEFRFIFNIWPLNHDMKKHMYINLATECLFKTMYRTGYMTVLFMCY